MVVRVKVFGLGRATFSVGRVKYEVPILEEFEQLIR